MVICLAAFLVLLVGMVFWPVVWVVSRAGARKLSKAFGMAVKCVAKSATFQKCEVRFEDRVKNWILKKVVVRHPKWTKTVAVLIYVAAVLMVLAGVIGVVALVLAVF